MRFVVSVTITAAMLAAMPALAQAQFRPTNLEAGAHFGFDLTDGDIARERAGVQALVGIVGPVEVVPAFSYLYNFLDDDPDFSGSAWQTFLTARVRPLGPGTFFSAGYGFTAGRVSVRNRVTQERVSRSETTDVGVLALELPFWSIRPFGEMYLLNLLDRDSAVGVNAVFGLNVRLP